MDGNLALSIESRITKAINIITAVQQTCPVYVADSLEEALDILRETKAQVVSPTTLLNNQSLTDVERVDVLGTLLTVSSANTKHFKEHRASFGSATFKLPSTFFLFLNQN